VCLYLMATARMRHFRCNLKSVSLLGLYCNCYTVYYCTAHCIKFTLLDWHHRTVYDIVGGNVMTGRPGLCEFAPECGDTQQSRPDHAHPETPTKNEKLNRL
jgi:hypothetical protein